MPTFHCHIQYNPSWKTFLGTPYKEFIMMSLYFIPSTIKSYQALAPNQHASLVKFQHCNIIYINYSPPMNTPYFLHIRIFIGPKCVCVPLQGQQNRGGEGELGPPILNLHTRTLHTDNRLHCSLSRQPPPPIIFLFHRHCSIVWHHLYQIKLVVLTTAGFLSAFAQGGAKSGASTYLCPKHVAN